MDPSADFQGWELLQANSDAEFEKSPSEVDSEGFIQTNYFSSEPQKLASSENPSWIDPVLEEDPLRYLHKESGDFWSDSSSKGSLNRDFTVLEGNKMGPPEKEKSAVDDESIIAEEVSEKGSPMDPALIAQEGLDAQVTQNLQPAPEILNEEGNECKVVSKTTGNEFEGSMSKKAEDAEKDTVWWKMPLEYLKYCVFKMNPVWSVSFAAALMGFVILGRKLYRMRNKARALEVKVAVDNKKVSQVMNQAARLNEAFPVVKRIPAIRSTFPAIGSTAPLPIMSLR